MLLEKLMPQVSICQFLPRIKQLSSVVAVVSLALAGCLSSNNQAVPEVQTSFEGLEYQWEAGQEYEYAFTIQSELNRPYNHAGTLSYKVEPASSTGDDRKDTHVTAFVVSSDGYVLSCAHVLRDADEVAVTIAGKDYPAKVIERDELNNIALLKVPAEGLQPLPVGNSSSVQQGETIRVAGFPRTTKPEKTFQFPAGAVAGFRAKEDGGQEIQIDVQVTQGHTGGPLVDNSGNVVGVVAAPLIGVVDSKVSFGVPSNKIKPLLERHRVSVVTANSARQSISQLESAAKASTGLITVKGSDDTKTFDLTWRLSCNGYTKVGTMRADNWGVVTENTSAAQLPYLTGSAASLFLNELTRQNSPNWKTTKQTEMVLLKRAAANPLTKQILTYNTRQHPDKKGLSLPSQYQPESFYGRDSQGRHRYGVRPNRPNSGDIFERFPALEVCSYTVTSADAKEIKIDKRYVFKTLRYRDNPFVEVKGTGTLVFDPVIGMAKSYQYDGTLVMSKADETVKVPVKVSYQLRDRSEVTSERKDEAIALIAKLQKALASGKWDHKYYRDLRKLAGMDASDANRSAATELAKAIFDFKYDSKDKEETMQELATDVVLKWASPEDQGAIFCDVLSSRNHQVKQDQQAEVYLATVKYGSERGIKLIIRRLRKDTHDKYAAKALVTAGPECEALLLEAAESSSKIKEKSPFVLETIGTEKCIPFLEQLERDCENTSVRGEIRDSREKVLARLGKATPKE